MSGVKLTWQQRAALRAIARKEHSPGEDVCEATIALEGIMPWRPCDNLIEKGLIERTGWSGPEEGWCFVLTDKGRTYVASTQQSVPEPPAPLERGGER